MLPALRVVAPGLLTARRALTRVVWSRSFAGTAPGWDKWKPQLEHVLRAEKHGLSDGVGSGINAHAEVETPSKASPDAAAPAVLLRPYQADAVDACVAALARGKRRIGVSAPTGSGKTTMFMHLIPRALDTEGGGQTLVLVGSVELALQAEAAARRILGTEYTVEVEQARRVASGHADVTIATWQTLSNLSRLRKFDPARFKLLVVDEAHHAAAASYLRLLHYFNSAVELPPDMEPFDNFYGAADVPIVGFSATFARHDALALSAAFEEIVFHRDVGHMLDEGCPVKSTAVYADLDLDEVQRTAGGEYVSSSLAAHVNTAAVNEVVVRTWLHLAASRRSTLVFAVDLAHVDALVSAFRAAGVDARSVSSATPASERRDTVAAFRAGAFPVLVNCEVLTEGADVPQIDCVVLARPTRSKNLLAQMVGRGLRLSPDTGKVDCHVLDIADTISRARGMLVAPTLFGLSVEEVEAEQRGIDAATGTALRDDTGDAASPRPPTHIRLVDSADPFGLLNPAEDRAHAHALSPLAWVHCGAGRHVLELMGAGHVTVEPAASATSETPGWSVSFTPKLPPDATRARAKSPYARVQAVAAAESLERSLATADAFVARRTPRELARSLARSAPWRARPASQKQVQLLRKFARGRDASDDADDADTVVIAGRRVPVHTLTAGQVAAYLCARQHGALGVRKKADARAANAASKARRKLERERAHAERNLPFPPANPKAN